MLRVLLKPFELEDPDAIVETVLSQYTRRLRLLLRRVAPWSTPLCGGRGRPVSGGGRVSRASSKLPCIVCLSMQSYP
eukprot:COSAG04_NODE_805_length_10154_cov_9.105122_3_plen_77_part_00